MSKIKVTKLRQLQLACPTMWDGHTDDKHPVHIQYRHGRLQVFQGTETAKTGYWGDVVLDIRWGSPDNGSLPYDDLRKLCSEVLDLPDPNQVETRRVTSLYDLDEETRLGSVCTIEACSVCETSAAAV